MKILISGAGVAGPCLAYWLLKEGKGQHEIVIVERAPELRTGGYLIDFWGIGYEIATRMGIIDNIKSVGHRATDVLFVDEAGKRQGGFKMEVLDDKLYEKYTTLKRSDLARLIFEALPLDPSKSYKDFTEEDKERIEVRFDIEITQLETEESKAGTKAIATFSDGNVESFDLVVGADGLHSNVRSLAFEDSELPPEGPLKDLGLTVAIGEVKGSMEEHNTYELCSVPGLTAFTYEMKGDGTMVMFIVTEPTDFSLLETPQMRKDWVLDRFKDFKFKAPFLLEAVNNLPDLWVDTVSQTRLNTWSKPGVVLVGDAAGAPSLLAGEGTGLGLTGAYCLAHALNTSSTLADAMQMYEGKVKPFVTKKQDGATELLFIFGAKSWFQIWLRNTISSLFVFKPLARWVLGSYLKDDIELPSYD